MKTSEEILLEINVNYEKAFRTLGEYRLKLEEATKEQERLRGETDKSKTATDKHKEAVVRAKGEMAYYKDAIRLVEKEVKNNVAAGKAQENSMKGLKAQLSNLTATYESLGDSVAEIAQKDALGKVINDVSGKLFEQEKTLGNFRRQVGNYEVATKSIRGELKELTEQIGQMKIAGKEGSDEYIAILKRASEVKDAFGDAAREINAGASDTKGLDRLKGSADLLAGSFTALNAVQGLFGDDSEEMRETIQKVQLGIGALSAATALQNTLQKEGAVMQMVMAAQSKARTIALGLETKGTWMAATAQKAFNLIAKANPYVLLALALVTVVGALVMFAGKTETAAEKQERLNRSMNAYLNYLEAQNEEIRTRHGEVVKVIENEIALRQAQGASAAALEPLYQRLHSAKLNRNKEINKQNHDYVAAIDANRAHLKWLSEHMLTFENNLNKKYTLEIKGTVFKGTGKELMDIIQKEADATNRKIQIGVQTKTEIDTDALAEERRLAAKKKADAEAGTAIIKERKQREIETTRQLQDTILATLTNSQQKQIEAANLAHARQIEDLKTKLETEKNLSQTAKNAINQTILTLTITHEQEIAKINEAFSTQQFAKEVEQQRLFIEERLLRAKEGTQAEHQLKMQQLALSLEEELQANAAKEEHLQLDAQLIRQKYAAQQEQEQATYSKTVSDVLLKEAKLRIENEILLAGEGSAQAMQIKLEAKRAEIEALAMLDEESDAAFLNRKLRLKGEEEQMIEDIAEKKRAETNDMLTAVGSAFGAISGIMSDMAENNEDLAKFAKVLALFEIGVNTGVAISNAIKSATAALEAKSVIGMIAAIAAGVAATIAAIGQATQIVKQQKEPKAPKIKKFATGGLVQGQGTSTSDSIPSMLSAGESVLTAYATSMFGPILSSFNQIGGGVPIQAQNVSSQIMGEDMLARAFAKGAAMLPAPQIILSELREANARNAQIEQLRTLG